MLRERYLGAEVTRLQGIAARNKGGRKDAWEARDRASNALKAAKTTWNKAETAAREEAKKLVAQADP